MLPFSAALGLLLGLLSLELVMLLLGGSLMSGDGPDADIGEIDAGLGDLDAIGDAVGDIGDLAEFDIEAGEIELNAVEEIEAGASGGVAAWLGLGKTPTLIWLAVALAAFGLSGATLQVGAETLLGSYLAPWTAVLPSGVFALWFARGFSGVFARLLPQDETSSISEKSMGRRKGVITQGTALRGRPAEVKITDGFGNTHYLRAEPLKDDETLAAGTDVLVLRHRPTGTYRLVALSA